MRKLQLILGVIFVTGFMALGIAKIVHSSPDTFRFSDFELKNTNQKLQELESKYNVKLKDLDKAMNDKTTSQKEIDRLKDEKEKVEKENADVKAQLQAKIDLKNKLAQGSTKLINKVTGTQIANADSGDNKSIVWNYLIAQGFTRNQTAGIMGNLEQEHGFQTSGDGLAQWTDGRKANLMSRANPTSIYTQLDYLMEELNGGYANVKNEIKSTDDLASAVIIFQNKFEVCNPQYCMQNQRISYAQRTLQQF